MKRRPLILIYSLLIMSMFITCQSCSKDSNDEKNSSSTVTDIDGNVYNTVKIGTQIWMVENLKVTRYNDGNPIANVTESEQWNDLTTPAYCWYENNPTYGNTYGALYNWYTIDPTTNGGKNICPNGWRVPSDNDWEELFAFCGGWAVAGGKLKEEGTSHWRSPNTGATNEFGFTGLAGGHCMSFDEINERGQWWTSDEYFDDDGEDYGNTIVLEYDYAETGFDADSKHTGYSIRCIKN